MDQWLTPAAIIALAALALGLVNAYYLRRRDHDSDWKKGLDELRDELDKACERIGDGEGDLKVLKKQVDLFWMTIERQVAKKFRDED